MSKDNQEPEYRNNNILGILAGMLLGGLAGAITMLLFAPQSGRDTRIQIQEKGIELCDRTTEMVEDVMSQVRSKANKLTISGREKIRELKEHGQELVAEQLEHVSEAAQAGKMAVQNS
jgi:gas vesicle protein